MKQIISAIFLLVNAICFSQISINVNSKDNEYNSIMSYTPKSINFDLMKTKNKILNSDSPTLMSLEISYQYQKSLNLDKDDIKIIENLVDQFAVAFFIEGKPIIMEIVGGANGCPDEMSSHSEINGKKVTVIYCCLSCTEPRKEIEKFVGIVNYRTKQLLSSN